MKADPVWFIRDVCKLDLQPFQTEFLTELFKKVDGNRRYSGGLLGLPRGNGKSELCGGIAVLMLVERPQAEVIIAAGSRDQANEVFKSARRMIEGAPVLARHCKVLPGRRVIQVREQDSSLRVVSAEGPLQHGLRPSCVIFDEVWNQPNRELWEALTGSLIKTKESLLVAISTAGYDSDSLLADLCRKGEAGDDPRWLYRWHGLPKDSPLDYRDPETWKVANPALGSFLPIDGLQDDLHRMFESEFRRWHLNQWTDTEQTFISAREWDLCSGKPHIPDQAKGVWLGVDIGLEHDSSAVATVWMDPEGTFHVRWKIWTPPPQVNLDDVLAHIRSEITLYPTAKVAYDKMFFAWPAQRLADEGVQVVEFPQSNLYMAPGTQTFHQAVTQKRIRHGGDRVARSHVLAAAVRPSERGVRVSKAASHPHQTDAAIAALMAIEMAARQSPPKTSAYETSGVLAV